MVRRANVAHAGVHRRTQSCHQPVVVVSALVTRELTHEPMRALLQAPVRAQTVEQME